MSKVFGYPEYDEKGEKILTTYDNEYKAMMMDIRVYRMKAGETRTFLRKRSCSNQKRRVHRGTMVCSRMHRN